MIDSVSNSASLSNARRTTELAQTSAVRNATLNAVQQKTQQTQNASVAVKTFAVPQTTKTVASAQSRLPRGSIVDVLT